MTTPHGVIQGLLAVVQPPDGTYPPWQFREGSVRAYGRFNLGRWLVGSVLRQRLAHKRFVRECFYPRERFTSEPANTLQLFMYSKEEDSICVNIQIFMIEYKRMNTLSENESPCAPAPQKEHLLYPHAQKQGVLRGRGNKFVETTTRR